MANKHHGSTLAMRKKAITRTALSRTMRTSRTLINRLLDPSDTSTTLSTLVKAEKALGVRLIA